MVPMKNYLQILFILSFIFVCSHTTAQSQPEPGMVISEFGPSYNIENPDYKTSLTQAFKVVFDITETSEDPSEINNVIHDDMYNEVEQLLRKRLAQLQQQYQVTPKEFERTKPEAIQRAYNVFERLRGQPMKAYQH